MFISRLLLVILAQAIPISYGTPIAPSPNDSYEYVVVGSGAGGGNLA